MTKLGLIAAALLVALQAAMPTKCLSAAIEVAGKPLVLTQPPGYCWLEVNGRENEMAQQAAAISARTGLELLALFAECKELQRLRARKQTYLATLGQISALRSRDGVVRPTQKTRAEVLRQALQEAPHIQRALPSTRIIANQEIPGTLLSMNNLAVIATDSNAIYLGTVIRARTSQGRDRLMAAVLAHSLLNDIEVLVRLGDDFTKEPYDFRPLLLRTQKLAEELVNLN